MGVVAVVVVAVVVVGDDVVVMMGMVMVIIRVERETVPSQTSDMGKNTVSVLALSFLLP